MKRLSTLLLALVCAVGTLYAGNGWTPNDKYCKWGDNFRFDHAFEFYNAGAYDNTYGDGMVGFQRAQGIIAFSFRAWNEFNLPTGDNYLAGAVTVYLTANGQNDMPLVTIHMKDANNYKRWKKTFEYECHFDRVEPFNDCTAYFLQKRQVNDGDDQYAYFNIVYSQTVFNYIHNNKNKGLGLRLNVWWDGNNYDNSRLFEQGELNDILPAVLDPTLDNFRWTRSNDGKTAISFTVGDVYNSQYYERATGRGINDSISSFVPRSGSLNRERTDVADLTPAQLNLMGRETPPYVLKVSRRAYADLNSSYYDGTHGGPRSPFVGPQSDWKTIRIPALYLPQEIDLFHEGGDTIYTTFKIPKKAYGEEEDQSAIIIEYSTDPNFGSFETVREDFRTPHTAENVQSRTQDFLCAL